MSKKHTSFLSHLKDKYKVFSMRNTKNRIFSRKKVSPGNNSKNEKMKGVNISFEHTCSDSVKNSSSQQISSTSVSFSSDNSIISSSDAKYQKDRVLRSGRTLSNTVSNKNLENTKVINSDKNLDENGSCSDSSSLFNNSLPESSPTSLLSDSSTSSNPKYKNKEYSSDTQSSTCNQSNPMEEIDHNYYDSLRTSCKENNSEKQENPITKRKVNIIPRKPTAKLESYTRNKNTDNHRENVICINKSALDILNNKHSNKEEKRTTQQVVAIESLGRNEENAEKNFPNLTSGLSHQKDNRCSFEESKTFLDHETSFIPIIIETDYCHQYCYLDYDILIDCVYINDYQCHLHNFTDILN
ncbi:uncharacterized protein cubi_02968 [Cryptosporidium ubiquitum]|uniref:Uncharacterized protein n=1 Tax=Cryptosporidium ubiquitum TaxID=857276 RepID=A0A1J4MP99_9CRYT|nr:uncharacterized protein cubi_02968 [Cryptosporidium ubiquitum]OII74836.1 hypothetical protein cubi_02968 [Cryptosporidium ubiquitum]